MVLDQRQHTPTCSFHLLSPNFAAAAAIAALILSR